ncbi:MAG TPA: flagellar filament capping protein FliD [Bryobacteraceae bacterium]|jgi:flagellar hook-associated protein 2|nr:flagellar filament capping protein FliD [Bryobacteraceae bacterium]
MSSSTSTLFTPLQFTGISQYSSDFQSILSRAVSIADIPAKELQQQEALIQQQQSDLTGLGSGASAVQSALAALGQLGSGQALSASSSDSSVVTVTNTGATQPGNYSITNVTSLATPASLTSGSYANATSAHVSSTGTMQLVYGSHTYTLTLNSSTNNLNGVAAAINQLGAGVNANVITTSSGSYLSVSASNPGATTLRLNDDPTGTDTNVLTNGTSGTNTVFKLNGISVSESSTTINDLIPGVTLSFSGTTAPNETVSLGLSTERSQISTALQQLVSTYNTLLTASKAQQGTGGGTLAGNNIIYQINQALTSIVQYQGGSNGMSNLANLGIEINETGQMSFNQSTFNSLNDSQITASLSLLGSSTSGIGGLQRSFDAITNSATGSIASQEGQWSSTVTRLSNQITAMTTQIQAMEQTLNRQLQAADASVAQLANQQSILTASITSLNYTSYGYNSNPSTTRTT